MTALSKKITKPANKLVKNRRKNIIKIFQII